MHALKAKHLIFLLSSWQHAEDQLCATLFSPFRKIGDFKEVNCNPLLDTSSVGFPSPPKTVDRKVITGADVTCDANVTSGLFFSFFFF